MPVNQFCNLISRQTLAGIVGVWGCLAAPVMALELDLPANMVRTAEREEVASLQPLPSGAFTGTET